ncbi:nucleolar protein 6-like [Amphiura filiformis]|uniref:nucleolar protein 6-like n=1 Tax=Amphiura filiformis TaxID=82378 RepID=UPI003B21C7B3
MVKRGSDSGPVSEGETPTSPTQKKPKVSKEKLYKPPTSEELASLKETQTLYQSSLFKFKMQELISEVQLPEKKKKTLTSLLHSLNDVLTSLPDQKITDLSDTSWLTKHVKVPLQWAKTQLKGEVCFQKPSSVKVVGSFLLDTCLYSSLNVDVAVEMPMVCFHQKDYLNFRYHHKRALYVAYLVKHLRKNKLVDDVQYSLANGDKLRPIVVLKLMDKSAKKVLVRLHPCPSAEAFRETRFLPSKSNIRRQWYTGQGDEDDTTPTPIYNASILADLNLEKHLHHLYNTSLNFQGFKDGLFLLKVWLHQRQLDMGTGAFSGFIMSMLVSYLLSERKIHKVMSGYQIMRNTLLYLGNSKWTEKGITMCTERNRQDPEFMAQFDKHFDVVFVDSSGCLNLCASMTKETYERVRHEAKLSMDHLDNKAVDAFDVLFMTPAPFVRKFDHIFHIQDLKQLVKSCKQLQCEDRLMETGEDTVKSSLPGLMALLRKALGKRVYLLGVRLPQSKQWPITSAPPVASSEDKLTFGLLLNTEFSTSILDKGPAANSPEAAAFQQFWGDKSELRRFQDTSICEAVVWPGNTVAEKRLVCQHVVRHILHLHAGIDPVTVTYTGGRMDTLISTQSSVDMSSSSTSSVSTKKDKSKKDRKEQTERTESSLQSGEEENVAVIQAYTNLSKCLRKLEGLPLAITSVQGVSPVFRYAEVFPPSTCQTKESRHHDDDHFHVLVPSSEHKCPKWVPALQVLCQMEGSGQWPDKLDAIQRIRAAFLIRIGELLHTQHDLITLATTKFVDVLQDGYVFRVQLSHRKEIGLAKESLTPQGLLVLRDNAQSMELERAIIQLPRLTSMLHGLQQQYNTYSNTVRLAKRWVCAHLLSRHIRQECVELIVAYVYLQPAPYSVPSSPMSGFLHFLQLLSTYDWNTSPLIVNLNNELTDGDYDEIKDHFNHHRSQLPKMFIATPMDKLTSTWTKDMPTSQILQRLIVLAKESLQVLETQLNENNQNVDTKQIFRPPLDPYDVIIHLRHKLVPRLQESIDTPEHLQASVSIAGSSKLRHLPVVNFDPVDCFINDLQAAYGEMALFFHDMHGGDFVAVLWKPTAFKPQPFKVKHAQGKIPKDSSVDGKDRTMIPNLEAIVEDFKILGQGLVKSVEVRTHNIEKWM